MKTPRSRAAATARFIAGASSPTRRVAPLHQCWFHMSQMMMAVCAGCHSRTFSLTTNDPPAPALAGSRTRACKTSGPAAFSTCCSRAWATHNITRQPTHTARVLPSHQSLGIKGNLPSDRTGTSLRSELFSPCLII